MISAEIVKDSVGPNGIRLTTFLLKYPRFIHSEFMTHRVFSRNASSSRAIPSSKTRETIAKDPAMPISFLENKRGMQGGEPLDEEKQEMAKNSWLRARNYCLATAMELEDLGVSKQYVNRITEPWSFITVVVTATEYDNFFALRMHPDAQPEIAELAAKMYKARDQNIPIERENGDWHLPFVEEGSIAIAAGLDKLNNNEEAIMELIRKSVACCARTSYNNHDKTTSTKEQNDQLFERLTGSFPIHASPAEHQARAVPKALKDSLWQGNFRGWVQFRKLLKGENITNLQEHIDEQALK